MNPISPPKPPLPKGLVGRPARQGGPAGRKRGRRAATLLEIMVAMAVLTVAFSGIYGLFAFTMREIAGANAASVAQVNTLARMDQIKNTRGWSNFSSPTYFTNLLNTAITSTAQNVTLVKEVVTVCSPTGTTTYFTVTKNATGSASSSGTPPSASAVSQLNIRVRTEWKVKGRVVQHEVSTLVSRSGVL